MADASLYLFDGYNLLHAGPYVDARELADALASFVATRGARGVVVFDGAGDDMELGPLSVRFVPDADTLLERLAAEHRTRERVVVVSSDRAVLGTAGRRGARLPPPALFPGPYAPKPAGARPPGRSAEGPPRPPARA